MTLDPIQNKIASPSIEDLIEQSTPAGRQTEAPAAGMRFDQLLGQMVHDLDSLQKTAGTTLHDMAETKTTAPDDVARKMKEADDAYNLMMQIRHKLVDVYSAVEGRKDT